MEKEKNNIEKIIENTIKNLEDIIVVDKIVGNPILGENGQTVVPISNVTIGLLTGGGEYGGIKNINAHFAGGTTTVCSIKPSCFLIDNGKGFDVVNSKNDSFEKLIKAVANLIAKIK